MRLISSTNNHARLYDMFIARPAAEIESQERIFSSSWILPGPMRPCVPKSTRRLNDGSDAREDFRMFSLFMRVVPQRS
jgi:hypothetical protein